jgi:hypothetical protein
VGDSAVRLLITLGARSAWWEAAERLPNGQGAAGSQSEKKRRQSDWPANQIDRKVTDRQVENRPESEECPTNKGKGYRLPTRSLRSIIAQVLEPTRQHHHHDARRQQLRYQCIRCAEGLLAPLEDVRGGSEL